MEDIYEQYEGPTKVEDTSKLQRQLFNDADQAESNKD